MGPCSEKGIAALAASCSDGGSLPRLGPNGAYLAVGGYQGTLSLWGRGQTGGEVRGGRLDLQWGKGAFLCLASSPDGKWLAVSDNAAGVGLDLPCVRLWPWAALRSLLAGGAV